MPFTIQSVNSSHDSLPTLAPYDGRSGMGWNGAQLLRWRYGDEPAHNLRPWFIPRRSDNRIRVDYVPIYREKISFPSSLPRKGRGEVKLVRDDLKKSKRKEHAANEKT